ncbi:hypothetical protein KDK_70160 [Dictyobacter kobayashii]|uniref:Uncharacterized protein n=2 Tax=Dictyobacter kobayashii TaxID=2014872 RepID=A0A402AVS9_9CHLR|nr:hypothetical protein KDK_70160 [Dictyobacter kobayashii]
MKERVSHRFTLNAETTSGTYESELLNSSKATADLSARYLNAIRLSQDDLDGWIEHGAHPENLPNACNQCPFKATCHDAFGYVDLNPASEGTQRVGLYPFNEEAIWTMYQQLDRSSTAHTPRSLLSSVVGYVLESHGPKIPAGEFPPQANHMGSDFRAPSLYNLSQRQLLRQQVLAQGGSDTTAIRLESLILFWGTRSINSSVIRQRRLVGGLSQEIFQAFNLPFIDGEVTTASSTPPPSTLAYPLSRRSNFVSPNPGSDTSAPSAQEATKEKEVQIPIEAQKTSPIILGRYTEDINNWSNGAKLQNYEKLRELLVSFIETSIDWEMYAISTAQVKDRIKPLRMAFEDQVGKTINTNDSLVFKRSLSMVTVLQALDYLNVNSKNPAPEQIGGYLILLSSWLTENEADIVAFAQRPTAQSSEKRPLISIALANCVLLSCLQGTFEHRSYSARELLSLVLTDCVRGTDKQWQNAIAQSEQYRSKKWASLMTGVVRKDNYINTSRKSLLQLLNRPQGGVSSVRFIDADLALDILETFEQNNWNLSPMEPVGNSASKEWAANYEINQAFIAHFGATLKDERALVTDKLNALQELIGNSDPKEVFAQIQKWIDTMKQLQKPYQLEVKSTINAQRLTRILNSLEQVAKENRPKALALRLSGIISTQKEATEHLQFLQSFKNEVGKQLTQLQQRFDKLRDETARSTPPALVERTYQEVENIIQHTLQENQEVLS